VCVSAPYAIPVIVNAARQIRPRSILDIGVGHGKYGVLFREYLDVWDSVGLEHAPSEDWTTRLEGVEIYPAYLTPLHDFIYDKIHVGDILDVINKLGQYDLIFMGDVLEHFEKHDGERLIRELYERANKCVLLTYPTNACAREGVCGNEAEAHKSVWTRLDFRQYKHMSYTTLEDRADVVALAKSPHQVPFLVACMAARRRIGWKGKLTNALVNVLGPSLASSLVGRIVGHRIALRAE